MSNHEKNVNKKETDKEKEKVVTRYDLKMKKRKEEKEKEKKQERISMILGVLVVVALACLVASFPLRTYLATHENYVEIGGDKITRVEYDYNYNLVMGNYLSQNGFYLQYMGVDLSGDLSKQMYSDTLTWKDFFDQMAVDSMVQNKAMLAQAQAAGFTYDVTQDYADYEQDVKDSASEAGMGVREFVAQLYGPYATQGRIAPFVKEGLMLNAYYEQVADEKAPQDAEIEEYYQLNTSDYDKVDYRVLSFDAELPTEPTELADPAADNAGNAGEAGSDGASSGTADGAYQPSEAEIAKAMEDAKALADAAESTVGTAGELNQGIMKSSAAYAIREWLFEESRTAGDTSVIEDSSNHRYYVVAFEKRYLDMTPSADLRVLITETEDAQGLLDSWAGGEATEESFAQMCREHSQDGTASDGGLYEGMVDSGMDEALSSWIFDSARQPGDTTAITLEEGFGYVFYYVGANEPEYKLSIRNTLLSQTMDEYLEEISRDITVEDPKRHLAYLYVDENSADAEGENAGGEGEASDGGESSSAAESTEG